MKVKTIMLMVILLVIGAIAAQADLSVTQVKVDGDDRLGKNGNAVVERGDEFDVRVRVYANTSLENVVVSAEILGYEFSNYDDSLEDQSSTFDLEINDSRAVTLSLKIPNDAEKDEYDLRIRVASRKNPTQEILIPLRLDGQKHEVMITDIQVADTVLAGRSVIGNVRVENIGQKDEDSIKVTLSIPELNIQDSEYIDELDADDATTSEDLLLRVPSCTEEGTYDVVAEIRYNGGYVKSSKVEEIKVLASELCTTSDSSSDSGTDKTVVTVPAGQEVMAGKSAVYPITISNLGGSAKTYVITVSPSVEAFGTYRIDPSNVMIVEGGKTKTAYVYVTIDQEAQTGLRDFKVTVTADGEAKEATLTANIVEGEAKEDVSSSFKTGLQISLLVLVVLLLILLIIFGFNKMKSSNDDEDEEDEVGQTYY